MSRNSSVWIKYPELRAQAKQLYEETSLTREQIVEKLGHGISEAALKRQARINRWKRKSSFLPRRSSVWTKYPDLAVKGKELWENSDLTCQQIAKELGHGLSEDAVGKKAKRERWKSKHSPFFAEHPELYDPAKKLYENGVSLRKIAAQFGMPWGVVRAKQRSEGWEKNQFLPMRNSSVWTQYPELAAKGQKLREESDLTWKQIAEGLGHGLSEDAVKRQARKEGWERKRAFYWRPPSVWTQYPELAAKGKKLREESDLTCKQIAEELGHGLSENAVRCKARKEGWKRKRAFYRRRKSIWTQYPELEVEGKELWEKSDRTCWQIARKLGHGLSEDAVKRQARKEGWERKRAFYWRPPSVWTQYPELAAKGKKLREESDLTWKQIAEELGHGVSENALKGKARINGWKRKRDFYRRRKSIWTQYPELEVKGKQFREESELTWKQIARKLGHGLSENAVRCKARKEGWERNRSQSSTPAPDGTLRPRGLNSKSDKRQRQKRPSAPVQTTEQSLFVMTDKQALPVETIEQIEGALVAPPSKDDRIAALLEEIERAERPQRHAAVPPPAYSDVLEREIERFLQPAENPWDEARKRIVNAVLNLQALLESETIRPDIRQNAIQSIEAVDRLQQEGNPVPPRIKGVFAGGAAEADPTPQTEKWRMGFLAKRAKQNSAGPRV